MGRRSISDDNHLLAIARYSLEHPGATTAGAIKALNPVPKHQLPAFTRRLQRKFNSRRAEWLDRASAERKPSQSPNFPVSGLAALMHRIAMAPLPRWMNPVFLDQTAAARRHLMLTLDSPAMKRLVEQHSRMMQISASALPLLGAIHKR